MPIFIVHYFLFGVMQKKGSNSQQPLLPFYKYLYYFIESNV